MSRKTLAQILKKMDDILNGPLNGRPYELDWDVILPLYKKLCGEQGDLDEFCHSYVTGYALLHKFASEDATKEAMYLHLRNELLKKKRTGKI